MWYRGSMEAAERDLILQFLWTRDETDAIDSAEKLRDWLVGLDLLEPGAEVSDDDVRFARHFRAATRSLCASHSGQPVDARTMEVFDRLNAEAPLQVTVKPDR